MTSQHAAGTPVDCDAVKNAAATKLREEAHEATLLVNTITKGIRNRTEIDLRPSLHPAEKKLATELELALAERNKLEPAMPGESTGVAPPATTVFHRPRA